MLNARNVEITEAANLRLGQICVFVMYLQISTLCKLTILRHNIEHWIDDNKLTSPLSYNQVYLAVYANACNYL